MKEVWISLQTVFRDYRYVSIAVGGAFLAFAALLWGRNVQLIYASFASPRFSTADSVQLMVSLLGGIVTDTTAFVAILTILLAALFGVNLALIVYHLKRRFQLPNGKFGASTIGSMIAATAGAGCASCGTLVLGSFLSSAGVLGMPLILPFDGQELLVVSIALLLISIYGLVKSRQTAAVCAADAVNH
jgi:hypothetical protein